VATNRRRRVPAQQPLPRDHQKAHAIETQSAVTAFLHARLARGCRPKTLAWYNTILGALARRYISLPAAPGDLETFLAELTHVSDETRFAYWRALRTFYRWTAERYNVTNAMLAIARPFRRRKIPPSLSEREVLAVMSAARTGRDKALLTLLLDTGLRIGEAHSLTWTRVGVDVLTVNGKVGEREVPYSRYTRWVMLGVDLPWTGREGLLTVNGMQQAVRRCLRRAGLTRGSCHILRHTFARLYLRAGGDVFSLQRIMGHADISTTRIYAELEMSDIIERHHRYSPVVHLLEKAAG
jgi:site-specific recombinase XerD